MNRGEDTTELSPTRVRTSERKRGGVCVCTPLHVHVSWESTLPSLCRALGDSILVVWSPVLVGGCGDGDGFLASLFGLRWGLRVGILLETSIVAADVLQIVRVEVVCGRLGSQRALLASGDGH